ncbi:MAG: hypothetical protein WC557_00135 [Ignavibacteriaceae bacterium]
MKKHILFVVLVTIILLNLGCKKTLTGPEQDIPGRRDYVWTVDTLKANPGDLFYMFSLWGSSPTDIWAVGSADASDLSMWHYDGVSWTRNITRLSSSLMSVHGFAKNDVWASSSPGGIYHFDGQQWSLSYANNIPGTHPGLDNIWGDSQSNIYAVGSIDTVGGGYSGEIVHFDGSAWDIVLILKLRVSFNWIKRGIKESSKYYLTATRFESVGDTNKIYELDGTNLKEIYSGQEIATVNEMAGRIYLCIGKNIYKYLNNQLTIWKDFSGTTHVGRIWGRSEKDFFTVGGDGLTHYNGTDLITIYSTSMFINDAFIFEKDIFILCNNRIIIHGKLSQP